jgi:mRNA interferase MazF
MFGDIFISQFPFTSGTMSKVRPVLVLFDLGQDVIVCRVTSVPHGGPLDVVLSGWQAAGLLKPSVARLDRLVTAEKSVLLRRLGCLTSSQPPPRAVSPQPARSSSSDQGPVMQGPVPGSHVTTPYPRLDKSQLSKIVPGVTAEAEAEAVLGKADPANTEVKPDGSKVSRYFFHETFPGFSVLTSVEVVYGKDGKVVSIKRG